MSHRSHVVVVTHERSGTHVAIDAIRSNFPAYRPQFYVNLDRLLPGHHEPCSVEEMTRDLALAPRVVKTHLPADYSPRILTDHSDEADLVDSLFAEAKLIYVCRNARGVLRSLYRFYQQNHVASRGTTFSRFLREVPDFDPVRAALDLTPPEYWAHHVSEWLDRSGLLYISFEDLVGNYDQTLAAIAAFLGEPVPARPVNVVRHGRRKPWVPESAYKLFMRKVRGVHITSVQFGGSRAQAAEGRFTSTDDEYLASTAGGVMRRLGYH